VKSQGKTITSLAVCHDSKTTKSTRQSFFNFQENLNEDKWIPSKSWRRSPGLIRCIGTFLSALTKWAYFRPFSNVISIKTTRAARKKYLQYGRHPSMTSSRDIITASPLHKRPLDSLKLAASMIREYLILNSNDTRHQFLRYTFWEILQLFPCQNIWIWKWTFVKKLLNYWMDLRKN
jgi:hypothetical protein